MKNNAAYSNVLFVAFAKISQHKTVHCKARLLGTVLTNCKICNVRVT